MHYDNISRSKISSNYPAKLGTVINKMRGANHDRPMIIAGPTPNNDISPVARGSPVNNNLESVIFSYVSTNLLQLKLQQIAELHPD